MCVLGLVIQHAMCTILLSVACPALQHFPYYLINSTVFEKKKDCSTQNVCFDFLYIFCLKHFSF